MESWKSFLRHRGQMALRAVSNLCNLRDLRTVCYLWAFPATAVGLVVMMLTFMTGGRAKLHTGVIEVVGGFATFFLSRVVPLPGGASAMTIGHVVIARTWQDACRTRSHERVHVRQYERWGPLFIPMYFAFSARCWWRGQDSYFDNPFEQEAYKNE
jgi:hypothetical protein